MMMSAMRRSRSHEGRSKKSSPKVKRRSRRGDHHNESDKGRASSQPRSPTPSDGRQTRLEHRSFPRPASSSSFRRNSLTSKNGDVADSGIDSGNGIAEPESPELKPNRSSSASKHNVSEVENRLCSSSDTLHHTKPQLLSGEDSNRSERNTGVKERSRKRSKSKHKTDQLVRPGDEADQNAVTWKPPVPKSKPNEHVNSDNVSASVTVDKPSTPEVTEKSVSPSASPRKTEQSSESEEDVQKLSVTVPEKNGLDADSAQLMVVSCQGKERKRRLSARLEQAKQSLESPHISAAVEAYELSEGPLPAPPNTTLLREFRQLFQQELTRLRMELDTFRSFCSKQMEREASVLYDKDQDPSANESSTQNVKKTKSEQENVTAISEEELQKQEENLASRIKDLQEYEKEILEVESMLNQRQAICERRQSALLTLDEELHSLREDIFDKKENLRDESDTSTERARKNWDFVRRHLTDKQAMLEATIQRFRTQIAAANASLAAKDSLIAHLRKHVKEAEDSAQQQQKKVEHLENKLVWATEEMHVLHSQQNSNSAPSDPASEPSLSQSFRASVKPTSSSLKRQNSSLASERETSAGQRAVSAPSTSRRMSSATVVPQPPDRPPSSRASHSSDRDQSFRRKHRQRPRSAASAGNAINNASAACSIL